MTRQRTIHAVFGTATLMLAISIATVPVRGYPIGASVALSLVIAGWLAYTLKHR